MPPNQPPQEPADDDDSVDPEGPDASEMDYSDEPDLEICPHCRKLISEESDRCPHCGELVNPGDEPLSGRAWTVIAVVIAILIALIAWRGF